jgi:alkanesulfonate monooxygenase SsuD/methylene tetrahydromethanopterin reductase-like flavin-dependent oxidoreductase (luciferase family)
MFLGFGVPVSGVWATPGNQVRLVRRAETLGYRTAWTFQRLLVPVEPEPDPRSGMEVYRSVLDPVVSLAHLAGRTDRIRLGVAVLNMPFASPVLMAKQLTTLDILSGGRLDVGLGVGWSRVEFEASGVPMERRGARADEFLAALRALWTEEVVRFDGEFYRIHRPGPSPSRSSGRIRRCCSAAAPRPRCAGRGGSPTAGSAPAAPTCATSTSRSPW